MTALFFIAIVLLGGGFVLFFIGLFPKASDTVSVFAKEVKQETSAFSSLFKPFLPFNKRVVKAFRAEKTLKNKIYLAKWKVSPEEFVSGKMLMAVLFFAILFFIFGVRQIVWLIVVPIFGFVLPDIMLNSRVNKRKYSIVRILPETIDLLGLCVGAGLDFMAAVRWVVDKVKINPMIEELTVVLKEINVGKPRIEALRDMSRRLNIPDVTSFVRTLVQADRMGTPVEEAFRILSEDTRMRRFHRGERQAMKAPLKMLIPLIFCILPVILIIVAGPIIIRFTQEGVFTTLK
ncbi:MAG: type II secretion system F family protein [Candidatus Omnitrophica bacterium]|nr:type II secretion system F family protein [Candidatus Omnitrophota bacterium]